MKILSSLDMSSQRIQSVASPSVGTDAANKDYVDNLIQGLSWKNAVRAASTANVTLASGVQNGSTLDGVTLATGNRILLKNQTTQTENGIYVVAASGAPTRATDADTGSELVNATVYVSEGSTLADTAWTQTANSVTLGSTNIVWAQVGGGAGVTAGNGLTGTTTLSVLADPVSGGGISVTGSGVKVDTAVVVRKFSADVGNGSLTSIPLTHNLGTADIVWALRDKTSNAFVLTDAVSTDANTLTLSFAVAPTAAQYRCTIHA